MWSIFRRIAVLNTTNDKNSESKKGYRKASRIINMATGAKYFNPVTWFKDSSYKRGSVVSTSWKNLKSSWRIKDKSEYKKETFNEALIRLDISESDLLQRKKQLALGSFVCYGTALILLLFSIYHAFHGNLGGAIAGILLVGSSVVCGLIRAFRVWQISKRRLAPFAEFISSIDSWIP